MISKKKSAIGIIILFAVCVSPGNAQYDRAQSSGDFPLPVALTNFAAAGTETAVVLRWTTASEVELVGFNLYRALGQQGTSSLINPLLIPASGAGSEWQTYQFTDYNVAPGFHYYYKISTVEISGRESVLEPAILGIVGNSQEASWALPPDYSQLAHLRLKGHYPEPFNGETWITFSVYEAGPVRLEVYNLAGQKIRILVEESLEPGDFQRVFRDERLPSGVYLYRLRGNRGYDNVQKMVLLR